MTRGIDRSVLARAAWLPGLLVLLIGAGNGRAAVHDYEAILEGAQVVPPTSSPGTGSGTFAIDDVANTVSYVIEYSGLMGNETAAHIHGMAPPGVNAGVVHPLPLGTPKVGVWNYSEAQEADILAGLTYVNIHTTAFPGGEIRGQIVAAASDGCRLNCPAGDGGVVNLEGAGNHSPDMNGDGQVTVADFALFAADFGGDAVCSDFDCNGGVTVADFALFASHFIHAGSVPGICE
jgi:hypothetical protein